MYVCAYAYQLCLCVCICNNHKIMYAHLYIDCVYRVHCILTATPAGYVLILLIAVQAGNHLVRCIYHTYIHTYVQTYIDLHKQLML